MNAMKLWQRFKKYYFRDEALGVSLDISRMNFKKNFFKRRQSEIEQALGAMAELERGAVANPDEARMVGHYWLRAPELASTDAIRAEIVQTIERIKAFARDVHEGRVRGGAGEPLSQLLLIGIGGSALGPQLVADALGTRADRIKLFFLDNTDPDGILRTLGALEGSLGRTLTLVISKSGGTQETRNGMLEAMAAYGRVGLEFAEHAVAVTGEGSALDTLAREEGWRARFPMWDWVGGRTSVTSAVGLLPAALQGLDIDALLAGARAMDELTRRREAPQNPALLLALMWDHAGGGRGKKDMVVLPYKDRLLLFSKYLQQLVMESLGKELDLKGRCVNQGIAVYGNKGSTDQHAYVQQLREGLNNFFVTFIEVRADGAGSDGPPQVEVEPGVVAGDYLEGFLLGTREALFEKERESITVSLARLDARALGAMIALYERAVGLYAQFVGINAYHQPGVEAGKKAARAVIDLQGKLFAAMAGDGEARTAEQWADAIGAEDQVEWAFKLLERLAANPGRGVDCIPGPTPFEARFALKR